MPLIVLPPLRARPEDVAPLARFFAARFVEKHGLVQVMREMVAAPDGKSEDVYC